MKTIKLFIIGVLIAVSNLTFAQMKLINGHFKVLDIDVKVTLRSTKDGSNNYIKFVDIEVNNYRDSLAVWEKIYDKDKRRKHSEYFKNLEGVNLDKYADLVISNLEKKIDFEKLSYKGLGFGLNALVNNLGEFVSIIVTLDENTFYKLSLEEIVGYIKFLQDNCYYKVINPIPEYYLIKQPLFIMYSEYTNHVECIAVPTKWPKRKVMIE